MTLEVRVCACVLGSRPIFTHEVVEMYADVPNQMARGVADRLGIGETAVCAPFLLKRPVLFPTPLYSPSWYRCCTLNAKPNPFHALTHPGPVRDP